MTNQFDPSQHDLGYLLTAYADGQLAPEGMQWVEQQLTERPELKTRLDEIRAVQQTLRSGLAGLEFPLALDGTRRASVLAEASRGPVAKRKIRFHWPMIVGLAAACLTVAVVVTEQRGRPVIEEEIPPMRSLALGDAKQIDETLKDGGFAYATPAPGAAPAPMVPPPGAVDNVGRLVADPNKPLVLEERQAGNKGREEEVAASGLGANGKWIESDRAKRGRDQDKDAGGRPGAGGGANAATAGVPAELGGVASVEGRALAKADQPVIAPAAKSAPQTRYPKVAAEIRDVTAGDVVATKPTAKPAAPPPPAATPAPDGYTRGNENLAYNGKVELKKKAEDYLSAAPATPAPVIAPAPAATAAAAPARPVAQPAKPPMAEPQLAQREKNKAQLEQLVKEHPELHKSLTPQNEVLVFEEKGAKDQALADARDGRPLQQAQDSAQAITLETDGLARGVEMLKEKSESGKATPRDEQKLKELESRLAERKQAQGGSKDGRFYLRQMQEREIDARRADVTTGRSAGRQHDAATNRALLSESLSMSGLGNAMSLLNTAAGDADVVVGQNGLALLGVDNVRLHVQDLNRGQVVMQVARGVGLQVTPVDGQLELDRPRGQLDPTATFGYDRETFRALFGSAPMLATVEDARSTFALDAETASYDRARAQVAAGQPIDPSAIRPEQFINAMPMDYPAASGTEAFTLYAEAAPAPFAQPLAQPNGRESDRIAGGQVAAPAWASRTALVAIGVVARPAGADERRPLRLTLAIDCSGSMGREGGLARVQTGLAELVSHLRADDTVALVAFSDQARLVLPATPGSERARIAATIAGLKADGATNAVDGLGLAYQVAAEGVAPGVESRVVLASDGATLAGPGDLVETVLARVRAHRERGVSLLVVGSGAGSYQAAALERLANRADGQQVFLASDEDAKRIFSGRLLPERLGVLAKDAKVQVTWNPQRVSHARLIGYEQRRLAHTDFRNDAVDAGELSHDAQVTALYEVLLVDGATGPLGSAAVRYHDTRLQQVRELSCPLPGTVLKSQSSDRLRLLACAAETAEWLQKGWWSNVRLPTPERIIAELGRCPQPAARELENLVRGVQQQEAGKRK